MKYFDWDEFKNELLKAERGVGFEDVQSAVEEGRVLEYIDHPNPTRYPNQKVLIIQIRNYVYAVPFVEDNTTIYLKTIYASRKLTKKYLTQGGER